MAVKEIPKAYLYMCDNCRFKHTQHNASGHYANSCPDGWITLLIKQSKGIYLDLLLCVDCKERVVKAISEALQGSFQHEDA
jgi:uncharacterized protein YlaI